METYQEYYEELLSPWLKGNYIDIESPSTPYKYSNSKLLAKKALKYFVSRAESSQPITYTGFLLSAGFHSRSNLDAYMSYSDDFKSLILTIKLIIEDYIASNLYTNNYRAAAFLLKNNYGSTYSETVHQIVEQKEYKIDINKPEEN